MRDQEEIKATNEELADLLEGSGLRSRLKAQIAIARLAPSVPGVGPVSRPTIVEELKGRDLELTDVLATVVEDIANYDSPDCTVMEYLSVNDKDAYVAWTKVGVLRLHKQVLLNRLRDEERKLEAVLKGSNDIPVMKQAMDAYVSDNIPRNPKG